MFTVRRSLSRVLTTIAALGILLTGLGPVPSAAAAADAGARGPRHPIRVGPRMALTSALSATHFSCQDVPLDSPDGPRCYSPQQIQTAYNVTPLLGQGLNGRGQTIVIIAATTNPYIQQDLAIFDKTFALPDPSFQVIAPYGAAPFDFNDDYDVGWASEISLDVEMSHAMAPGAKIVLAVMPPDDNGWNEILRYVVEHNLGDVISESIAEPESCLGAKMLAEQHLIYLGATLRHMSLVAASGDDGAANATCDGAGLLKAASYPAADPLVLAVGGTNLNADAAGHYAGERAWADPYSDCWPADQFGCSGGGYSSVFARPFYQAGVAHIQGNYRALPDVAFDAGFDGGVLFHSGVALQVYFGLDPNDPTNFFVAAGTSFGAPQWAGLTAIADQAAGHRLGWLNPAIYRLAANPKLYAAAFHDVTAGNNNYADLTGYPAQSRWDAVTGWGTPNAAVLLPLLNPLHDTHDDARGDQ
jgi:subtilase family serine protease